MYSWNGVDICHLMMSFSFGCAWKCCPKIFNSIKWIHTHTVLHMNDALICWSFLIEICDFAAVMQCIILFFLFGCFIFVSILILSFLFSFFYWNSIHFKFCIRSKLGISIAKHTEQLCNWMWNMHEFSQSVGYVCVHVCVLKCACIKWHKLREMCMMYFF